MEPVGHRAPLAPPLPIQPQGSATRVQVCAPHVQERSITASHAVQMQHCTRTELVLVRAHPRWLSTLDYVQIVIPCASNVQSEPQIVPDVILPLIFLTSTISHVSTIAQQLTTKT
jgi:hypothetical protein